MEKMTQSAPVFRVHTINLTQIPFLCLCSISLPFPRLLPLSLPGQPPQAPAPVLPLNQGSFFIMAMSNMAMRTFSETSDFSSSANTPEEPHSHWSGPKNPNRIAVPSWMDVWRVDIIIQSCCHSASAVREGNLACLHKRTAGYRGKQHKSLLSVGSSWETPQLLNYVKERGRSQTFIFGNRMKTPQTNSFHLFQQTNIYLVVMSILNTLGQMLQMSLICPDCTKLSCMLLIVNNFNSPLISLVLCGEVQRRLKQSGSGGKLISFHAMNHNLF